MVVLLTIYWVWRKEEGLDFLTFALMQNFFLYLMVSGAISTSESDEDKNNGYKFLRILPVKDSEIVKSKFLLVLISVVLLVGYYWVLFSLFTRNPDYLALSRTAVLVTGTIALILGGLAFLGIFKFGLSRMVKYFWSMVLLFFVAIILLREILLPSIEIDLPTLAELARSSVRFIIAGTGLAVYFLLMKIAVKVKEAREL
jgi:uncharacterized membrane protein